METCIKNILLLFRTVYGERFEITPATSSVWQNLLQGYPERELEDAARSLCKTSHFPPTPADLIDCVKKDRTNSVDVLERSAIEVWEGAKKKMLRDSNKYRTFLVAKCVPSYIKNSFEAVGGVSLCFISDIDKIFPRFERVFNELKQRYTSQVEETPRDCLPSSKMGGLSLGNPLLGRENDNTKDGN